MHIGAGGFAGDPLRFTVGQCGARVQAHRQFHPHKWTATLDPAEETDIQLACHLAQQTHLDRDAGRAQLVDAATVDLRERILAGDHHAPRAGGDQRIDAWRRASVMRARLQRHIDRGAARARASFAQGKHFCMRFAGALVEPGTDYFVAVRDHATDAWIGLGREQAMLGELQRLRHMQMVDGSKCRHELACSVTSGNGAQQSSTLSNSSSGSRSMMAMRARTLIAGSASCPSSFSKK